MREKLFSILVLKSIIDETTPISYSLIYNIFTHGCIQYVHCMYNLYIIQCTMYINSLCIYLGMQDIYFFINATCLFDLRTAYATKEFRLTFQTVTKKSFLTQIYCLMIQVRRSATSILIEINKIGIYEMLNIIFLVFQLWLAGQRYTFIYLYSTCS